jgi:hypothetical protein
MQFRGTPLEITLEAGKLTVAAQADDFNRSIKVGVGNIIQEIKAGESYTFST